MRVRFLHALLLYYPIYVDRKDMKATICKVQFDIDYLCPNCRLHFRLSNNDIPQVRKSSVECPSCFESLTVTFPEEFVTFPIKSNNKKKEVKDPVIQKAVMSMKSMGFNLSEATSLVNKAYHSGITVADLIKEAIRNVELSQT